MFKKNDKVICISDKFSFVTKDKVYTVQSDQAGSYIYIVDNDGDLNTYKATHFKPVHLVPEQKYTYDVSVSSTGTNIVVNGKLPTTKLAAILEILEIN
jgi:hypothetical protein